MSNFEYIILVIFTISYIIIRRVNGFFCLSASFYANLKFRRIYECQKEKIFTRYSSSVPVRSS